jgi:hypothetical protein
MIINRYSQQCYAYYSGISRELQIDDVKGKYYGFGGWSWWESLGGILTSGPAASS